MKSFNPYMTVFAAFFALSYALVLSHHSFWLSIGVSILIALLGTAVIHFLIHLLKK